MQRNGNEERLSMADALDVAELASQMEAIVEDIRMESMFRCLIRRGDLETFIRRMERITLKMKKIREGRC